MPSPRIAPKSADVHRFPTVRLIAVLVVVVVAAVSYWQTRKPTAQLGDFGAYYRAGQAVVAGRSPYTLDAKYGALGAYMYCPAFAHLVCRPLAHLPYVWAMRVFLTINWLATVGAVTISLRLAGRPGLFAGLIGVAAVGLYLWADLHNGQVGTLLLLACLAWLALTLSGRPVLGGIALALAVGLKIYPLLLAPYLLLRRKWWPGLIGLAVGLLMQFAAPSPFIGARNLWPLHRQWLTFCVDTQLPEQTYRAGNQSLLGVLARTRRISNGFTCSPGPRLESLQHVYPAVVLAVTAGLYGLLLARRRHADPLRDVSLLLIWMTVASPRAWTFNFVAELPAAVLLASAIVHRRRRWPLAVAALVAAVWAVTFPTNRLPSQHGWSLGTQFLLDKHFVAAVVLAVAVIAVDVGRGGTRRPPTAPP